MSAKFKFIQESKVEPEKKPAPAPPLVLNGAPPQVVVLTVEQQMERLFDARPDCDYG